MKKRLIATTLAIASQAIELGQDNAAPIATSQADCSVAPYFATAGTYSYTFVRTSCICKFMIDTENFTPSILCPNLENPAINPIFYFGSSLELCVEQDEADRILNTERFGDDCIPGNADDDENDVGDDDCPADHHYDFDYCGCVAADPSVLD